MDWVGRRVFERGFWKGAEDKQAELEVLDKVEVVEATDGIIEEDCDDARSVIPENSRRWIRIFRSAIGIANVVKGLTMHEDTRKWTVEGTLLEKVKHWKEEEMMKREEEAHRHMCQRFPGDSMDVDEEDTLEDVTDSEDDENDADEVKALKVGFVLLTMEVTEIFRKTLGQASISPEPAAVYLARSCPHVTKPTSVPSTKIKETPCPVNCPLDCPRPHCPRRRYQYPTLVVVHVRICCGKSSLDRHCAFTRCHGTGWLGGQCISAW
jgi:hypothetical protein